MKFPHDTRLRKWLEELCNALEGHDPEDIAICAVITDAHTMQFHIRGTHPDVGTPDDEDTAHQYLQGARDLLTHTLLEYERTRLPPKAPSGTEQGH